MGYLEIPNNIGEGGYPHGPNGLPGVESNWLGVDPLSFQGFVVEGPGLEERQVAGPYDAANDIGDSVVSAHGAESQAPVLWDDLAPPPGFSIADLDADTAFLHERRKYGL